MRNEIFDFPGAMSGPFRENNDLMFGQIRNGIDGRAISRSNSPHGQQNGPSDNEPSTPNGKGDNAVDHFGILARYSSGLRSSGFSHPLQQTNTARPATETLTGAPIEPSGSPVTG